MASQEKTSSKNKYTTKPGKSSMGQQVLSAKQTMPKVSIGKGTREAINDHGYLSEEHARRVGAESYAFPGAKYEPLSSLGKQLTTTRRNAPAFSMGRSKRFAEIPNFTPLSTPGPGHYE